MPFALSSSASFAWIAQGTGIAGSTTPDRCDRQEKVLPRSVAALNSTYDDVTPKRRGLMADLRIPVQRYTFVLEEMDDEALLYHEGLKKTIYLNETAAVIWKLCDGERTIQDIIDLLNQAYADSGDRVDADVAEAIASLAGGVPSACERQRRRSRARRPRPRRRPSSWRSLWIIRAATFSPRSSAKCASRASVGNPSSPKPTR